MEPLGPLMLVGTASDVGKSTLVAAFCRILKQEGYSPAPFKAQNMSNNSFPTPDGREIGRAQAMQAEAAACTPCSEMNPILLKPEADCRSQLILNGEMQGSFPAMELFGSEGAGVSKLFTAVTSAFKTLSGKYNPIILEGAGSISELNLKAHDVVNMRVAMHCKAATYLVADIDKGGVFGSVYGTMELLTSEERACIKGIIVNKFRGDIRLFEDGRRMLQDLVHVPVYVVPFFRDITLDEEDGLNGREHQRSAQDSPNVVNICVVLLPHMSNFTDFTALPDFHAKQLGMPLHLFWGRTPAEILEADIIIIPGSKSVIADMCYLQKKGIAQAIRDAEQAGNKVVVGICGGLQMMGETIEDPLAIESEIRSIPGIGILPVVTILEGDKCTVQRSFLYGDGPTICTGYEIHVGKTTVSGSAPVDALYQLVSQQGEPIEQADGFVKSRRCWGCYMHGILDNPVVVQDLLNQFPEKMAVAGEARTVTELDGGYAAFKEAQYDRLAQHVRESLDVRAIIQTMRDCAPSPC
eukprot:NODE_1394_length_1752_cov_63.837937_g1325_i0.p1 GENE.NODE_1394_length_1752_cov_63.837937_g1325_i0~~NODE_1394_length_1752_cov_63.837937_g1325_i0.p1  ORF type:complete len:541 (-),score=102.75 NODE_1394_length_1752_cov_63.837937_g1325_i0:128-1699(-)